MTDTAIATTTTQDEATTMEQLILGGDLSKLNPMQKVLYYNKVCESMGLNPLTRPFEYMKLQGREQLYPGKNCAEQLRKINGINLEVVEQSVQEGLLTIHVRAKDKTGRIDEDFGVVAIAGLRGEAASNAFMRAVTKGKRRVTLSICGLTGPDDSEVDSIAGAERIPFPNLATPKPVAIAKANPDTYAEDTRKDLDRNPIEAKPIDGRTMAGKAAKARAAGLKYSTVPPKDDADTDEPPVPTSDDYVSRWEILIENAIDPDKLLTEWKNETLLREEIDWPDSSARPRLQDKVKARREQLRGNG